MNKRKFVLGLWFKLSKEVSKTNSLRLRTRRATRVRPITNYCRTKETPETLKWRECESPLCGVHIFYSWNYFGQLMKPRLFSTYHLLLSFLKLADKLLKSSAHSSKVFCSYFLKRAVSRNPEANAKPCSGFMPAAWVILMPIWAALTVSCFAYSATALTAPCKTPLEILSEYKLGRNDKNFSMKLHFK